MVAYGMRAPLMPALVVSLFVSSAAHAGLEVDCAVTARALESERGGEIARGLTMYANGISFGILLAETQVSRIARKIEKAGDGSDTVTILNAVSQDISNLGFEPLSPLEMGGRIAAFCKDPANRDKTLFQATLDVIVKIEAARAAERAKPPP